VLFRVIEPALYNAAIFLFVSGAGIFPDSQRHLAQPAEQRPGGISQMGEGRLGIKRNVGETH